MNTSYRPKTMTDTYNHRSCFDWGSNMQVVHKGNGEIAMTEGELARFFGVTWRKLNYRLQTIMKSSNLHPDERGAGEEPVFINGQLKGYAPLYPLSIIIAMLSMSKTSNISYFNYLFNNYTLRCQTDVVRLIHATISAHCSYNGNHFILDIIQCNHRFLSSFYKRLIILCNLWTSSYSD